MRLDLNCESLRFKIKPRHGTPTEPNFGLPQIDSLSVGIGPEAGDPRHMLKTTVFCDVTLCSLLESYRSFGGTWCLHLQGRTLHTLMETAGSFEMLVTFCQSHISEDCDLHIHHREIFRPHSVCHPHPNANVKIGPSGNSSDLYSGRACFESRAGHQLP
jgi:hypothetical protein